MTGDCHVRFYQRLGAQLPRPTNRGAKRVAAVIPGGPAGIMASNDRLRQGRAPSTDRRLP
jgi:hypothetical protein